MCYSRINKCLGIVYFLFIVSTVFGQQNNSITIIWDDNNENDGTGYRLYYGHTTHRYSTAIDVGNQLQYVMNDIDQTKNYYFSVTAYDKGGNESCFSNEVSLPSSIIKKNPNIVVLFQNYPNPLNPHTTIPYYLADGGRVTLKIINCLGQTVRTLIDDYQDSGMHEIEWNGKDRFDINVASGVYFVQLKTKYFVLSNQLLVTR